MEIIADINLRSLHVDVNFVDAATQIKILTALADLLGVPIQMDTTGLGLPIYQLLKETGVSVEKIQRGKKT